MKKLRLVSACFYAEATKCYKYSHIIHRQPSTFIENSGKNKF